MGFTTMSYMQQWPKVDRGFKLCPPIMKWAACRPRTRRYKGWEEGRPTRGTAVACKTVLDPADTCQD